jgi:hypothetical protein
MMILLIKFNKFFNQLINNFYFYFYDFFNIFLLNYNLFKKN